jgi:hypothetical protein
MRCEGDREKGRIASKLIFIPSFLQRQNGQMEGEEEMQGKVRG